MSGMSIGSGNAGAGGAGKLNQPRKTVQPQALQPNQQTQKPNELDKNKEMAASMLNPAQGPKLNLMG